MEVKAGRPWLRHARGMLIAVLLTVGAAALSLLSLGLSGYAIYAVASPVLRLFWPPIWAAKGPWLWPVLIGAGILWSLSFLVAGGLDEILKARGVGTGGRRLAYAGVLWLGAVLSWGVMLHLNAPPDGFRA